MKDIKINGHDKKRELSVHVISEVNSYTRIKTKLRPRVGIPGELIGSVTLSSVTKKLQLSILFLKVSLHDYESVCNLDCLGIKEKHEKNNEFI